MTALQQLDPAKVATVAAALTGKRLEHFQASVAVLNEALAAGGWSGRAAQQSSKGFSQGFPHARGSMDYASPVYPACFALRYGQGHGRTPMTWADLVAAGATEAQLQALSPRQPLGAIVAWVDLVAEVTLARRQLDALRKLPQVTPVGLSPKVTATLTEMGLALDLQSIQPTKIGVRWVDDEPTYYWDWTPGTVLGRGRFAHCDCEACGKYIPSKRFVAIEADCKINGRVGLFVGCDCARNIFGIKDEGLPKKQPDA